MDTYEIHPVCACVPDMRPAEYKLLVEDIRRSGRIREPLVVIDRQILDGRHRYKAHQETGIGFETREFDPAVDGDPVEFVRSRTLHRSMTPSQRAVMSARLDAFTQEQAQAMERKKEGHRRGAAITNAKRSRAVRRVSEPDACAGRAAEKIAQQTGASTRMIQRAQKLLTKGHPDIVQAVDRGQLSLTEAEVYLDLPATTQARIAADADRNGRHMKATIATARKRTKARGNEPVVPRPPFVEVFLGQMHQMSIHLSFDCGARTPEEIVSAFDQTHFDSEDLAQRLSAVVPLLDALAQIAAHLHASPPINVQQPVLSGDPT